MIKIIVDSICDLPEEIFEKYNLQVLPLKVSLNDVEYLDKVTIQVDELYSEMRKGIVPKTSQVSPGHIYELFDKYCKEGTDFIYLAFSSALSGTCSLAQKILEEFKEEYPERKMAVIDSKSGSSAIGLMVLQALKMLEKGYDFDTVKEQIEFMVNHIEHVFFLTDLSWLVKGGRIGKVEGALGSLLDINPIIEVNKGKLEVIKKVRGRKKTINAVLDLVEERMKKFPDQLIAVSYADEFSIAEEAIKLLEKRVGKQKLMITRIGCVLSSHLGLSGVGILFMNEKPSLYIDEE